MFVCCRKGKIEVNMREAQIISSAVLSAEDKDTPRDHIYYLFDKIPENGHLQLKVSLCISIVTKKLKKYSLSSWLYWN